MITKEERSYLITSMSALLNEYGYKYTEEALGKIVDRWAEQKADLIKGFKNHPNYVEGKFLITLTSDFERAINVNGVYNFSYWLSDFAIRRIDLTPKEILDRRNGCKYLPSRLYEFLSHLGKYAERCVSAEMASAIKDAIPEVRVHVGEKTSRAINRILTYLNYHKVDGYNREFAKYADSLSPITIKRNTILSINPLDYLTMSFGNSWASCHTIDKTNKRGMENSYGGAYSTGTMSYMLDSSSMVFYTVGSHDDNGNYWTQDKIHRQMYHYGEEKLIQGRLYPQDNDGCSAEYAAYRNIVQSIVSTMFDFTNLWTLKTGASNASEYVYSCGTHYRDYENFDNCSISRIKGSENYKLVTVGAKPICVRCGEEHNTHDNIDHCFYKRCKHCERIISDDDVIEIDGGTACRYCAHKCDVCGKYHIGTNTYVPDEGIHICETCRDEHFAKCKWCGKYVRMSRAKEKDGYTYCEHCLNAKEAYESRGPMFKFDPDRARIVFERFANTIRYVRPNEDEDEDEGEGEWLNWL